jgi:hypothetical protein
MSSVRMSSVETSESSWTRRSLMVSSLRWLLLSTSSAA